MGVEVKSGRKWQPPNTVDQFESRLWHSDIVETVAVGRQGLGTTRTVWKSACKKDRHGLVQQEFRQMEEEHAKQEQSRSESNCNGCIGKE